MLKDDGVLWLNGVAVPRITADLGGSADLDLTTAQPLHENAGIAFQGPVKVGSFDVPGSMARHWLALPNVNAKLHVHADEAWGVKRVTGCSDSDLTLHASGDIVEDGTVRIRSGATTFVEVGPGNVLSGLVKRIDRGVKTMSVNSLESLERAQEALAQ